MYHINFFLVIFKQISVQVNNFENNKTDET